MDTELQKMLVKTINIRVPSYSAAGDQTLGTAVPMAAHVELVKTTAAMQAGKESVVRHVIVTMDEIRRDDRVWMPGDDSSDINLGKLPVTVQTFFDPETGLVDHYETTV